MDDWNWEEALPQPSRSEDDLLNFGNDDNFGEDAPAAAPQHLAIVAAMPAPNRGRPRPPPSKWTLALPAPQYRNAAEKALAASRMRDVRSATLRHNRKHDAKESMEGSLSKLRDSGLLRDGGRTKVKAGKDSCVTLCTPDSGPQKIPYETLLHVSYSAIRSIADVARAFHIDPRTIRKSRVLTASALERANKSHKEQLGAEYKRQGLIIHIWKIVRCNPAHIPPYYGRP